MGRPKRSVLAAVTASTTPPEELAEHQFIARVGKPEGNNTYTCILPNTKTTLVELAQRFRNTIWIKRGGFVVVDLTPSEERKTNNKVEGEIINVVRDEKEWRKMPYWYETPPHPAYTFFLVCFPGLRCTSARWSRLKPLAAHP
jgi:probable RNA-binding protein EIF1AD